MVSVEAIMTINNVPDNLLSEAIAPKRWIGGLLLTITTMIRYDIVCIRTVGKINEAQTYRLTNGFSRKKEASTDAGIRASIQMHAIILK